MSSIVPKWPMFTSINSTVLHIVLKVAMRWGVIFCISCKPFVETEFLAEADLNEDNGAWIPV